MYLTDFYCPTCKRTIQIGVNASRPQYPAECGDCTKASYDRTKAEFLAKIAKMPLKARVQRIEEWMYGVDVKLKELKGLQNQFNLIG